MKRALIVFTSNEINLYGTSFSVRALESGLSQSWNLGMPSFLSHDAHRPIGWSRGLGLHFEPGLVRLTGLFSCPENGKESKEISRIVQHYLSKHIADMSVPHLPELKQRLKCCLSGKETVCTPDCVALVGKDLARKTFSGIFDQQDKDGLIPLSLLVTKAPGVFEKDGLLVFAHPCFRRSFYRLNALNEPFFQVLQKISNCPDLDIRIALDKDTVGLSSTFRPRIELEYWWGPKFSNDLSAIPAGVTRHESNKQQRFFHGISRTEFWWYIQDKVRTFECEELRDIPGFGFGDDNFGCRFVHSMLNPSSATPIHLDGAIRTYDGESMINRLETDISRSGRQSKYMKLWRVDGSLNVQTWKELIAHYYRDNHLIGEYLGGQDKSERLRLHSVSSNVYTSSLGEYVPCNMEAGRGVRIAISYHPKTEESAVGRIIRSFDFLTYGSTEHYYVEADTLEIVKVLHRMDEQIELPENVVHIAFKDMVLNFPLIMHFGPHSVQLARKTQKAIAQLCRIWVERGDDRVVSYNIGIRYTDRDVYFSVAGHIVDLNIWHQHKKATFPADASRLGEWCEIVYKILTNIFPESDDMPPLRDMLQESGILTFNRRFLKPEERQMHFDENTKKLVAHLTIPKANKNLYNAITSNRLELACMFLVRDSKCSHCRKSYHLCNCSKYLDLDVIQIMNDISLLGSFWTNRKA